MATELPPRYRRRAVGLGTATFWVFAFGVFMSHSAEGGPAVDGFGIGFMLAPTAVFVGVLAPHARGLVVRTAVATTLCLAAIAIIVPTAVSQTDAFVVGTVAPAATALLSREGGRRDRSLRVTSVACTGGALLAAELAGVAWLSWSVLVHPFVIPEIVSALNEWVLSRRVS